MTLQYVGVLRWFRIVTLLSTTYQYRTHTMYRNLLPIYNIRTPTIHTVQLCWNRYTSQISGGSNANKSVFRLRNLDVDYNICYVFEVESSNLHDLHSDYPLVPVRQRVTPNRLPPSLRKYLQSSPQLFPEKLLTNTVMFSILKI